MIWFQFEGHSKQDVFVLCVYSRHRVLCSDKNMIKRWEDS